MEQKTYKQMWYQSHKDDEDFIKRQREQRMKSYYKHQEKQCLQSNIRYYEQYIMKKISRSKE
jgi:hypothetical protein